MGNGSQTARSRGPLPSVLHGDIWHLGGRPMSAVNRHAFLLTGPDVDHIGPGSLCYALPAFPPPDDFPMMVDLKGEPVCRYSDHQWRIGASRFNFGTDPSDLGSAGSSLTEANGDLLKIGRASCRERG